MNYEEFEKLLKNLAIVTNNAETVFDSERTNNSRQRSLFELTGGSPRTTVMLFKHIVNGFSGDIIDDLEVLTDGATPLYKAKFEELPEQQQIIVDAIAMNWDAISFNKLSKTTRYASNQISPQLKRLIDEGWIESTPADKKSRKALRETEGVIKGNAYFISERFFNIWYLLRYDILKEGIYCLSRFLECYYGKEEFDGQENQYENAKSFKHETIPDKFHLVNIYRDKLNEMNKAKDIFKEIEREINIDENREYLGRYFLHKTLFELYDQNMGLAGDYLSQVFGVIEKEGKISSLANEYWWMRFGSVVLCLGHGSWLLSILEEKGYDVVLSPYYTAIQALEIENQNSKKDAEIYLNNRAIEISEPAKKIIATIRKHID